MGKESKNKMEHITLELELVEMVVIKNILNVRIIIQGMLIVQMIRWLATERWSHRYLLIMILFPHIVRMESRCNYSDTNSWVIYILKDIN